MNLKNVENTEAAEIDLRRLFGAITKKSWLIIAISVLCAALTFLGTFFLIAPKYEASAKFYVNNNAISVGNTSVSLSSGDLTTSRNLVDSYIVILNTRETLNDVIDYAGVNRTYETLEKMISADAVDNTEIFKVTVTSTNPSEAEKIANAIAYILTKRISTIIEGTDYVLVEMPQPPWSKDMYRELEEIRAYHGLTPIIAHIDRYIEPFHTYGIPQRLEAMPVLVQANASSFLHRRTKDMALKMVEKGQIHLLGSDYHNLTTRPPRFGKAMEVLHHAGYCQGQKGLLMQRRR